MDTKKYTIVITLQDQEVLKEELTEFEYMRIKGYIKHRVGLPRQEEIK